MVHDHMQVGARDDLPPVIEAVQDEGRREERLAPVGHAAAAFHLDAVWELGERAVCELDACEQCIAAQAEHLV